jgi:hypothetical protein
LNDWHSGSGFDDDVTDNRLCGKIEMKLDSSDIGLALVDHEEVQGEILDHDWEGAFKFEFTHGVY